VLLVARLSMAVSSACAKSKKQSVGAASAGRKSLALAPTATDALVLVSQRQSLPDW
jgi:hypothetical protein